MDEEEEFLEEHKIVYVDGFLDVAYFRFTPIGLSTRWYSKLSRWTKPIRSAVRDEVALELPMTNGEVLDALYRRVCAFNQKLLAGFRAKPSERKLVRNAFQHFVSPNAPVGWSHGILSAVVLDRLLWADNLGPLDRPPQAPHRAQALLKADAGRMRKLYDEWPSTVSEFVRQWTTSCALAATASDSSIDSEIVNPDDVVASLVRGISETSARARTSVVENNFCYAALGVLCLTLLGDKEMKSTALGDFISKKTGIKSDVLRNAKAYQLVRTAYTMAVFSPICLLGPYILTNTGKTRIYMYNMVDALCSPALEDDEILTRVEYDVLNIVLKMVTHGRGIYHSAISGAVERWVNMGCGENAFDVRPPTKKIEWAAQLEWVDTDHPLSKKMCEILTILSLYKGKASDCPVDTKEDQFLLKVARDHENILGRIDFHDDEDDGDEEDKPASEPNVDPDDEQPDPSVEQPSPSAARRSDTAGEANSQVMRADIDRELHTPMRASGEQPEPSVERPSPSAGRRSDTAGEANSQVMRDDIYRDLHTPVRATRKKVVPVNGELSGDDIESGPSNPVQQRSECDEIEWDPTQPSPAVLRDRNLNLPCIDRSSGLCAKDGAVKRRRVTEKGATPLHKKAKRGGDEAPVTKPRRSLAYDYPRIERDPVNDPSEYGHGHRVRTYSPYKYTRDRGSRKAFKFTDGLEKWNMVDTYVVKWPAMREIANLYKTVMANCVEPSLEGKIRTVSRAFWDALNLRERRKAFKDCNVFVADRDHAVFLPVAGFTDTDGLCSLLSTVDERAMSDMSVPGLGRGRRASLDYFLAIIKESRVSHALLFYEEDVFADYFIADVRSFDDASPFIADQSEDYMWGTDIHPVDFGARWATFSSADVMVSPHLSSAGLCTVVRVIKGRAIAYIGDATPAYARKNSRNLEGTAWQAIGLEEGDQIYLRPDTMYGTVMLEDCIIMGAHFYFADTLNETLESLLLQHFHGEFYTGTALKLYPKAIIALFKLVGAWAHMSKPGGRPWRLPDGENVASLLLIIQHAPQLYPLLGKDDPYLKSESFSSDWARACQLARCFWAGAKSPALYEDLKIRYIRFNRECDHYYKEAGDPSLKIRVIDLPSKYTL